MAEKILATEKLSDSQLEKVTGGTYLECRQDARRFTELGIPGFYPEKGELPFLEHDELIDLTNLFSKYGVDYKYYGGDCMSNEYFIDGKKVSREDAWKHIENKFKK